MKYRGLFIKQHERAFTFRIHKPPIGQALDDLTQHALAELHVFVVADNPVTDEYLFIVATTDASVTADQILRAFNRLDLDAEFVDSTETIR